MKSHISPEIKEIMEVSHYHPSISIILPFDINKSLKTELAHCLKTTTDKIENQLNENYHNEITKLMVSKLKRIITNLDYKSSKKSIAIYISPVFEKILYLDLQVEEKIIIDDSFEIRDLVYSKKLNNKFLVLLLSGKESKLFLANNYSFLKIDLNIPETIFAYINEVPERVANFSDVSERKEILTDKFLHHIDIALDEILINYKLPLFVIGVEKILGHFKSMTKHINNDITYIHGNYIDHTLPELKKLLNPYILRWLDSKQKDLIALLEEAAGKKKLVTGIQAVWKEAINKKGKLLIVEKNYMVGAQHSDNIDTIYEVSDLNNDFSNIKDAVDDVIEKVLANGGEVEFVAQDALKLYDKIALIKYY